MEARRRLRAEPAGGASRGAPPVPVRSGRERTIGEPTHDRVLDGSESDGPPIHGVRAVLGVLGTRPPLHAMLVRFTIALAVASLALDVLARLAQRASPAEAAWWTLVGATGVTVFTIASGLAARLRLPVADGAARSVLRLHMATGPMLFGALLALLLWRGATWERGALASWWYVGALALVALLVFAQARLGAALVYRYGAYVRGRFRALPYDPRGRPRAHDAAPTPPRPAPPVTGVST